MKLSESSVDKIMAGLEKNPDMQKVMDDLMKDKNEYDRIILESQTRKPLSNDEVLFLTEYMLKIVEILKITSLK